jgi:hypothetical protein
MPKNKIWNELDLLCSLGIGLEAIAPDMARLLRELVGAEATAIFWLDERGMPAGFFHEDSPAHIRELFLNEFERLFVGAAEINVAHLAQSHASRIGHLLAPPASYFQSNTYNLLVRPSGHHHALDLRIDLRGQARAVVLLFRPKGQPFDPSHAALLQQASPYLERALAAQDLQPKWCANTSLQAHMVVNAGGTQILMQSPQASALLGNANLVGTGLRLSGGSSTPPTFIRQLCAQIPQPQRRAAAFPTEASHSSTCSFAVPGGQLRASATPLLASHMAATNAAHQVLITLDFMQPAALHAARKVMALEVSPLQREIALMAGLGRDRGDCPQTLGVSKEALKKHLRTVYAAAGVGNWEDLSAALTRA